VIGNGDVQCWEDVFAMLETAGCDAVMVGRALAARPWLLWQLGEKLGFEAPPGFHGRSAPQTPLEEGAESGRALKYFLGHLESYFPFEAGFTRFRFHLRMTCGWLEFGHHLFAKASSAKSYEQLHVVLDEFFAMEQKMVKRTALRE
jgi:tRNA-dihydrouridine synthase